MAHVFMMPKPIMVFDDFPLKPSGTVHLNVLEIESAVDGNGGTTEVTMTSGAQHVLEMDRATFYAAVDAAVEPRLFGRGDARDPVTADDLAVIGVEMKQQPKPIVVVCGALRASGSNVEIEGPSRVRYLGRYGGVEITQGRRARVVLEAKRDDVYIDGVPLREALG